MDWIIGVGTVILALFTFVLFVGPPYLPTLKKQIDSAFDLLGLEEGDTLLELGSGDGRVLKAAAKRGIKSIGIELNPLLVIYSKIMLFRYRKNAKVIWGSYWNVEWPDFDGIFTFMLDRYMPKLDEKLTKLAVRPIKIASFAFKIPEKKITKEKNGVFLYEYR